MPTAAQVEAGRLYNELKKKGNIEWKVGKRNKCVRYNKLMCDKGEHCENVHACIKCGERHPLPECPRK